MRSRHDAPGEAGVVELGEARAPHACGGLAIAFRCSVVTLGINAPLLEALTSSIDDGSGMAPVVFTDTWAKDAIEIKNRRFRLKRFMIFVLKTETSLVFGEIAMEEVSGTNELRNGPGSKKI